MQTWLITGANGNLGKRMIGYLLDCTEYHVIAVVRSESARRAVDSLPKDASVRGRLSVEVLDYTDAASLHQAARHADKVVHLVGILKQTKRATYFEAHEQSTTALVEALADTPVDHLTYLSIAGSSRESANACLASKGRAEDTCTAAAVNTCVLRVPMVLGEGDYASYALKHRAGKKISFTFRAASLEQPIYAADVVRAILAAGSLGISASLDLAGPELLSRRVLITRAAAVLGTSSRVISLPMRLGLALAGCMELLLSNPPMTRTMLDVLDHDDKIDPQAALTTLQLGDLTSLDDTLRAVLA